MVRRYPQERFPFLTAATLGATVLVTATRLFSDAPLDALRRDPSALRSGQVWRVISPVLVQSDAGLRSVVLVFAVCGVIGVFAERLLPRRMWLTFYVCGALAGHLLGEAFQPRAGGTSVAFVGILGGLGALAALGGEPALTRFRPQALIAIPLAILDTVLGDIHGAPYLVCFAIGVVWVLRERGVRAVQRARSAKRHAQRADDLSADAQLGTPVARRQRRGGAQ